MDTGYRAKTKYLPISPSKVRPIADLVRSRSYVEAKATLETLPNKGAGFLLKTLHSAAANAMDLNGNIDEEDLFVKELLVNEGTRHKRIWARGRGRADRQLKRYAHIAVVLDVK
ncbi:MAG: 50S ribosomal protein L22 [Spirochaetota bacterium]